VSKAAVFEMIVEKRRSEGVTVEQVRKRVHHDSWTVVRLRVKRGAKLS